MSTDDFVATQAGEAVDILPKPESRASSIGSRNDSIGERTARARTMTRPSGTVVGEYVLGSSSSIRSGGGSSIGSGGDGSYLTESDTSGSEAEDDITRGALAGLASF